MNEASDRSKAALSVTIGATLLGLSPIGVRLSDLGPQATNLWRFAFALPILGALAVGGRANPSRGQIGGLLVAGALFGAECGLWAAALGFTTVVNATLLSNMTSIFAVALGWLLFRERLKPSTLLGSAVALSGALTLAIARAQSAAGHPALPHGWIGDGLGFTSALGYAGYLMIVRALGNRVSTGAVMFWATLSAAALALVASLVFHEPLLAHSVRGWLILLMLGVVVQVGGQGLIAYGVGRLPIAMSTILLWMQPLAAAMLSWLLFGEYLTPLALAGAALILGGVFVVQRARPLRAN
jgi:drug/metabolite transporter (DMT)-like permease